MTLPVPTQRTWSVGDIVTAAEMNANTRDAVNFLSNPPICALNQLTTQSIPNNSFTSISFADAGGVIVDSYSGHSTTVNPSRYIAQVAGYYLVIGRAGTPGTTDTKRMTCIAVNGTLYRNNEVDSPDADLHTVETVALVHLNALDYVEAQVYQLSGGAISTNVSSTAYGPSIEVIWLHA